MATRSTSTPIPANDVPARERRAHERHNMLCPGKVFHIRSHRFLPARTINLSTYGALLEVQSDRPLIAGETLDVGVAVTDTPILRAEALINSKVIRSSLSGDGNQRVAVQFSRAMSLPVVAPAAAA
ncbi:MAG: PilZ domain-containing protein [Phycisphaerae bacterium]|nr:PilZ domain-containing protein [Phycisphaerae bacterium]